MSVVKQKWSGAKDDVMVLNADGKIEGKESWKNQRGRDNTALSHWKLKEREWLNRFKPRMLF